MKAGVGLVLEEAAAEAQDADKLWPIADEGRKYRQHAD